MIHERIIVTGVPRSGTSLMMQTLKLLGVDVVGKAQPSDELNIQDVNEKALYLNPRGFYETPFVCRGLTDDGHYKNKAVKIILSALTTGTSRDVLSHSKIIWCLRNPRSVAVSQKKLDDQIKVLYYDHFEEANTKFPSNPGRFIKDISEFLIWLKNNSDIVSNILVVDYDNYLNHPEENITKILAHTGITCSNITDALANISKALYRSQQSEWSPQYEQKGILADRIYEMVRSCNFFNLVSELKQNAAEGYLENVRWVDTEFGTGIICTPSLYRPIKINNRDIKTKLLKQAQIRLSFRQCPKFSVSADEYTVERPKDIGNLTRKYVYCDGANKTIEHCHACYTRRVKYDSRA